jgi:GNAT superfamily N-acetyltransferase
MWNGISVHVRPRTDLDVEQVVRIAEQVHVRDGYPKYLPDDLGRFVASSSALAAWVAEVDGEVRGQVALHPRTSDAVLTLASTTVNWPIDRLGVVARLLVAPEARRQGIGTALLETATAESLRRGLFPILDVVTEHVDAVRLYERAGWTRAGEVRAVFADGTELDEIVFVGPHPPR